MIIFEAYYRVKPGMREKLLEIVKPNVEGTRKEKGNISYAHYPSPENDQDMFVFEKWESFEYLMSHIKTEHNRTFCALRSPLLEPDSYFVTIYNAEENEEKTKFARASVKAVINPPLDTTK